MGYGSQDQADRSQSAGYVQGRVGVGPRRKVAELRPDMGRKCLARLWRRYGPSIRPNTLAWGASSEQQSPMSLGDCGRVGECPEHHRGNAGLK